MKKRWSSLSKPDCHENDLIESKLTPYHIKDKHGNEIGRDKWENVYGTRSTVNDETLKKKHILFLGDSFVFGHGVRRGATISDYFNEIVSEDYSCFNLGVPGTGFDTALLRLQQWSNMFGDKIHTVYFGISELSRHRHWESLKDSWTWEDEVYKRGVVLPFYDTYGLDYSPGFKHSAHPFSDSYLNQKQATIRKGYNNTLSKVNCVAKLDATVMAAINLSKIYNFNVYFFSTNSSNLHDEDEKVLKEQTESSQVKWCDGRHLDPTMRAWDRHNSIIVNNDAENKRQDSLWNSYFIRNDGHWSSKGCKMVAKEIFDETKHWY